MRRKIPSLQALACLEAAARHESYTRAAQELAMTQSAVSRQITSLEEFLGVALFRRTRHGVALTVRGAQYAAQVAPRLEALELTTLDVMSAQGSGGSVHLAAVPTFATRWLIPRLPQLAALHPEITVHIETRPAPSCLPTPGSTPPCTPEPKSNLPIGPVRDPCDCSTRKWCRLAALNCWEGGARLAPSRWRNCRCCIKARAPTPGANGWTRSVSPHRELWLVLATNCFR